MKQTQVLDALRNIKRRFISYQSIAVTVVMGMAGLPCIFFMESSYTQYATDYYTESHFKDFDITSTAGITDDDIKELQEVDGVLNVEGYYYLEGTLTTKDDSAHVTMLSETEKVSIPSIKTGEMPQTENECALDADVMEEMGLSLGDTISLTSIQEGLEDVLKEDTFTITGTFIHPDYLLKEIANTVLLDESAFDTDVLDGGYIRAYVELKDEKYDLFRDNEYFDRIRDKEQNIRALANQLGEERTEDIKEAAREKLEAAKAMGIQDSLRETIDIDNIEPVSYAVINRNTNEAYVNLCSSIESIHSFGMIFVPIFAIVGCLVIYITLATIISDQKRQAGALKAMGMKKLELRDKYLLFGLSAVIVGGAIGTGISLLLEKFILGMLSVMYNAGPMPIVFVPKIFLMLFIPTLLAAIIISWESCEVLIKNGAVDLMNGLEAARNISRISQKKVSKKKKSSGSLYSQMIINNIFTDKSRVIVSIVVIVGSVILVGVGLSLRNAFNSAFSAQENDIYRYDIRIGLEGDVDEEQREELESVLTKNNVQYLPALYNSVLYDTEDESSGFYIISADKNLINDYVYTGKDIPESGILVPDKFAQTHDLSNGITLYDDNFVAHDAEVKDDFTFYVGFIAVMSKEAYSEIFDDEIVYNSFFCSGINDEEALKREVMDIVPDAVFEESSQFTQRYESTRVLFNVIAIVMIIISGIVTFTVMINLTSIMVNRRMKELLTLRVNGYSKKQVIGYLLAETMLINIVGIAVGVIIGIFMNKPLIMGVEAHVVRYIRTATVYAWGGAALLNVVFAFLFNLISFRKVGKMKLTDISKY